MNNNICIIILITIIVICIIWFINNSGPFMRLKSKHNNQTVLQSSNRKIGGYDVGCCKATYGDRSVKYFWDPQNICAYRYGGNVINVEFNYNPNKQQCLACNEDNQGEYCN